LPKYFWLALAGVLKAGVEASAVVSFSTKTNTIRFIVILFLKNFEYYNIFFLKKPEKKIKIKKKRILLFWTNQITARKRRI